MRIPLLLADFIHARACRPKCEKFLTRPMEMATAKPMPEPTDPPEESRCKVIPFERIG